MDFKEGVGWVVSISGTCVVLSAMLVMWVSLLRRIDELERDLKKHAKSHRDDDPR